MGDKPTVDVVIYSHNHESFIEQCLRSVFEQQTDFPVHVRVHDDASTDETHKLLEQLAKESPFPITLERAPENRYQFGSRFKHEFLVDSTSRYLAVLDADDYWSDARKLARQVEVMEKDPSIALCHHAYEVKTGERVVETVTSPHNQRESGLRFAEGNFVGTATVMLRRNSVPVIMPDGFDELLIDDWPIWALSTQNAHVAYIDIPMAVYRLHGENNFANQMLVTKKDQTLRALIYLANSVDSPHRSHYTEALKKRIRQNRTSFLGRMVGLKEKLLRFFE